MKIKLCMIFLALFLSMAHTEAHAQLPVIEVIKKAVTKVIIALDLKIQRLQNKTIWLQNAQKILENKMSALHLKEIAGWVEKQRKLYEDYFQELWKVKATIALSYRVKDIVEKQLALVNEYRAAWSLVRQDDNFTGDELESMYRVYTGILEESLKNLDQLMLAVNAFTTQMTDAARLRIIDSVSEQIENQLSDLRQFTEQNKLISIQRASEKGEIEKLRKLYGL
jgi:hypothetical protein